MRWLRLRRSLLFALALSFLLCMTFGIYIISKDNANQNPVKDIPQWKSPLASKVSDFEIGESILLQKLGARQPEWKKSMQTIRAEQAATNLISKHKTSPDSLDNGTLNYNVHVFYYVWYGTPDLDDAWLHWAHQRLPHWDKNVARKYPTNYHSPPDDIGSSFYPQLGPYSSRDVRVIDQHMQQIASSGAGVLAVSWYPPGQSDDNGSPWDNIMPLLLDAAARYELKICFHIEPYENRSAATFQHWIRYIIDTYGAHSAFYRKTQHGQELPLFYLYDSYQVAASEWQSLLLEGGQHSVRGTRHDAIFIGLLVEQSHQKQLEECGFDGYYTYFASDGFTYGSTTDKWRSLALHAKAHGKLFIPSVGPGYIDVSVRPWNARNTKQRQHGQYYRNSWSAALQCAPSIVSVTSFNEWHEGTQIESAVPKMTSDGSYLDYSPDKPDFYLQLTRQFVDRFSQSSSGR